MGCEATSRLFWVTVCHLCCLTYQLVDCALPCRPTKTKSLQGALCQGNRVTLWLFHGHVRSLWAALSPTWLGAFGSYPPSAWFQEKTKRSQASDLGIPFWDLTNHQVGSDDSQAMKKKKMYEQQRARSRGSHSQGGRGHGFSWHLARGPINVDPGRTHPCFLIWVPVSLVLVVITFGGEHPHIKKQGCINPGSTL